MQAVLEKAFAALNQVILGKEPQLKMIMACLLAKGHLLIEDFPGMGKTTLAQAVAKVLGLGFQRIQFTSDLLPADIIGVSIFDKNLGQFQFRPGPVFAQVVLADEINRATPKAQGALLEAMEEHQVTVDGETYLLPKPFFVIATQNPHSQMGTFALPEAQLDRFLMRLSLGYPDPVAERKIIMGHDRRALIDELQPVLSLESIFKLQLMVRQVGISEALLDYVQRLVKVTRVDPLFSHGLSPRGALGLVRAAQSWAYVNHRKHVLPEDVQMVLPAVIDHRVRGQLDHHGMLPAKMSERLLATVDVVG
jgi:MoxR-like ATPase